MKTNFGIETFKLNEDPTSALGGVVDTPPAAPIEGEIPPAEAPISIYGDLEVKFPEGMDTSLQAEPSLKSFVDKETGEINYGNMMKSYVHNQKQVGANRVVIPGENATAQELDEFHAKLGYQVEEADYTLNRAEDATISEDRVAEIKTFAREHRLPASIAQKMIDSENDRATESLGLQATEVAENIKVELDGLKTEWGQAYDTKLAVASRVLTEIVNDDSVTKVFSDPRVGSNPAVIKALAAIGEKLFKEDGFKGDSDSAMLSPGEASVQINEIMGDRKGPYWNKMHPSHNDMVLKVNKLMGMKAGR